MKRIGVLLVTGSLFICAGLYAQDVVNNRYSDDDLFNKEALDRMIPLNGTCIKKAAPSIHSDPLKINLKFKGLMDLLVLLMSLRLLYSPKLLKKNLKNVQFKIRNLILDMLRQLSSMLLN
jgi:hypothetical protein